MPTLPSKSSGAGAAMYPWNRGRGEWIPSRDKLINQMYYKDLQGRIWKEERGWLSKIHSQIPSPFPGCSYSTPASCFTFWWIPEFGLETQNTAKDYGRKCTKAKSSKSKSTLNIRQSCYPYPHSLACFSSKLLAPRALAASFPLPIQRDWDIPPQNVGNDKIYKHGHWARASPYGKCQSGHPTVTPAKNLSHTISHQFLMSQI